MDGLATIMDKLKKKYQSQEASISTLKDNAILQEALQYEHIELDKGVIDNPSNQFDLQSFVNGYMTCKKCTDPVECKASSKGYCTTITTDGHLLLRQCKKYANYQRVFRQVLMSSNAQIPIGYKEMTFATLDTKENERAIEYAKALAINATSKGMFLYGGTGCGKTHIAIATLQIWTQHDAGVFFTLPNLLGILRDNMNNKEQLDKIMNKVLNTDLLVLDDMGAEKFTEWVGERMFQIINDRYINRRKTIITSNFSMEQLEKRMGEQGNRIMSRVAAMCTGFKVNGRDRRLD